MHDIHQILNQCKLDSMEGIVSFADIVDRLTKAEVGSYWVDFRKQEITYYLTGGSTYSLSLETPTITIPTHFSVALVQQAVRGAQQGRLKYPEFMSQAMSAGCIGYMVWIAGEHVTYFGHQGEMHIEHFPVLVE